MQTNFPRQWFDLADRLKSGIRRVQFPALPRKREALRLQLEWYAFRRTHKDIYPHLSGIKAVIREDEEGFRLILCTPELLESAEILDEVLSNMEGP